MGMRDKGKMSGLLTRNGQVAAQNSHGGRFVRRKLKNAIEAGNLKSTLSEGVDIANHKVTAKAKQGLPELEKYRQTGACNDIDGREIKNDAAAGLFGNDVNDGPKLSVHLRLTLKLKCDNIAGQVFDFHGIIPLKLHKIIDGPNTAPVILSV